MTAYRHGNPDTRSACSDGTAEEEDDDDHVDDQKAR
jgi:hypothetical protein